MTRFSLRVRWAVCLVVLAAPLFSACRTDVVPLSVRFRQEHSFLMSRSARLLVFESAPCTELIQSVRASSFGDALFDSGSVQACDVYNGEVVFEGLPDRELAFVALSYDRDGVSLLTEGCRIANPYDSDGAVVIVQDVTDHYITQVAAQPAECSDPQRRCDGSCP